MNTTGKWMVERDAEVLLDEIIIASTNNCLEAKKYIDKLLNDVAVRIRDIIDHIVINDNDTRSLIMKYGWVLHDNNIYKNDRGYFPEIIFQANGLNKIFIRVEFVEDFIAANGIKTKILGKKDDQLRMAKVFKGNNVEFWIIERHGTSSFTIVENSDELIAKSRVHRQYFLSRRRFYDSIDKGLDCLLKMVENAINDLNKHWACDLFLRAERVYWMQRNSAGRIQKKRQDKLGIGWANQDHHTFDSSREYFYKTILILEKLGFECRELFYAGAGAGWGSQILEQPVLKSVIFADIDLAPEELNFDFAHTKNIKPLYPLKRAGLWCAMHGESMLEAGLNHLECMFDAKRLNKQFKELNIEMMPPFSDFSHLYQALTVGEWWPVDPNRVDILEQKGHITNEEATNFRSFGAIGSHFENLERNFGFKGFNQPGIDDVLRAIDPRKQLI